MKSISWNKKLLAFCGLYSIRAARCIEAKHSFQVSPATIQCFKPTFPFHWETPHLIAKLSPERTSPMDHTPFATTIILPYSCYFFIQKKKIPSLVSFFFFLQFLIPFPQHTHTYIYIYKEKREKSFSILISTSFSLFSCVVRPRTVVECSCH